ncbi:uncharacterized protein [Triticum aestivum]|uniref:uncharacterized protein isoform X1 n=1 Tax=Triticum aestivum TaxID=4565 RepID=UPI001D0278F2|nr:uncharacterized protein LOC123128057 isoform X1 [Triticum aestivum]
MTLDNPPFWRHRARTMSLTTRWSQSKKGWQPFAFALFLVNINQRGLALLSSLGDRALFLSKDRCLCVSATKLPSISSNSIYFSLPNFDPGVVYSLSSGTFERTSTHALIHDLKERVRPSVRPFTLADHLTTYCHHLEWSKGLMFHEYYVIPLSWKEMLRKITLHDCEIQVSCVCEENEVGSLTSKKKNLGITDPVSVAATPALPRAWDCGLSGSAAHRCCAGRDCPCFPQVGPDHWGAEGDDILGCGAHCYYAAGRCWRTHTCLALEIVSFWSISRTDITRADFVVGWKMGD